MHPEALTEEGKKLFPFFKSLPPEFYLAGGTALALQVGHRISVDFDFFSNDFIPKDFLAKVKKNLAGLSVAASVNNPGELTVFAAGIKLTFLRYPFPVLNGLAEFEGIKMLDVPELAATKAYTIGRRGSFKDYIDLYFVLSESTVAMDDIIILAEKKYGDDFNSRLFLEQLVYLDDISDADIIFLKEPVTKKQLEDFFIAEIKKIRL